VRTNLARGWGVVLALLLAPAAWGQVYSGHGLSMFGELKYDASFTHFDYADPQAPKGGRLRLAWVGTFDTLNPFTLKGVAAAGSLLPYNRLMSKAQDEPFSEYGQLASSIECPADRSWVIFTLRPEARWHDGQPVTADDVVFTFNVLVTKAIPFYRSFYADIERVEALDARRIKFSFGASTNPELPLIIGQMRVLPKHYWEGRDFAATTLEPPLGSGPYKIEAVDPGRTVTYRRVEDYWGRNIPVHKGRHNFDEIRYDYYRDSGVAVEALKAGEYDYRYESDSKRWATAYTGPAIEAGHLLREEVPHSLVRGMSGFVLNSRRDKLADPRVRQALAYAFDFEWSNANLFHGLYTRSTSYWNNAELGGQGEAKGLELAILEEYRGRVPDEVFGPVYAPPSTDGSGKNRGNLRQAQILLRQAGWSVQDGSLTHRPSGRVMELEFLLVSPAMERVLGAVVQNLKRLGVTAHIRTVDSAQYQNRVQDFDYDVIYAYWRQTLSPGNEQRNFWSSEAADAKGSRNYAGVSDPVVDELVERQIAAPDRATQVAVTRALDRVLLWSHYTIPGWYSGNHWLLHWDRFGRPPQLPANGLGFPDLWWWDGERAAGLEGER
jgi:microcin C transport system substrate-binding protein